MYTTCKYIINRWLPSKEKALVILKGSELSEVREVYILIFNLLFFATVTIDTQIGNVSSILHVWLHASVAKIISTVLLSTFHMICIPAHSAWTILSFIPGIQIRLLIVLLILSAVLGLTTTRMM